MRLTEMLNPNLKKICNNLKIADTVELAVLKQGYIGGTPEMDNPDGREYLNRWQTPANDYTPCSPIRCS